MSRNSDPPQRPSPARDGHVEERASNRERNVLAAILGIDRRVGYFGAAFGIFIALGTHGLASGRAMTALVDLNHWYKESRKDINAFLWTMYEVDAEKAQPVKEEVKLPEPDPEPEALPILKERPKDEDIYKETKAQAKEAAKADDIYTAKADGQQPLDFGNTQVDGDGPGAGYGTQSAAGTGKDPVTDPRAKAGGDKDGNGSGTKPAAQPPLEDKSRPPTLVGSRSWNCPFPAEADAEGRDSAVVQIVVTVRTDGTPQKVAVLSDPGAGFGRAARQCALGRRYQSGLDRSGTPIIAATPPITVRFSR
jgi:periplasmic protein TonB